MVSAWWLLVAAFVGFFASTFCSMSGLGRMEGEWREANSEKDQEIKRLKALIAMHEVTR